MTTERLLIDLLTTDDADFILDLLNTKGWISFIGDRNIHSKEDALAYIHKILSSATITYWIVRLKETNASMGMVSFIKRDYLLHYDIGFAFLPEFEGKGYAYEAAKKVLTVMMQDTLHSTVLATLDPSNTRSIALLKKLGLHFDEEIKVGDELLHTYVIMKPVQ